MANSQTKATAWSMRVRPDRPADRHTQGHLNINEWNRSTCAAVSPASHGGARRQPEQRKHLLLQVCARHGLAHAAVGLTHACSQLLVAPVQITLSQCLFQHFVCISLAEHQASAIEINKKRSAIATRTVTMYSARSKSITFRCMPANNTGCKQGALTSFKRAFQPVHQVCITQVRQALNATSTGIVTCLGLAATSRAAVRAIKRPIACRPDPG